MVHSGNRDRGVLHFNNNKKKQVNKLLCVAIKLKHLLGKFYLTAWMVHDSIFINSNFFWNLNNFGDMVPCLKYTIMSSFKENKNLIPVLYWRVVVQIHKIALCILNAFKRK